MLARLTALAALIAAAALAASPALAGTVTVGQTGSSGGCLPNYTLWQLAGGASFVVPAGTWTITSWRTDASSFGGQMALVVLDPAGGNTYDVVASGPMETLTSNTMNTFATSIVAHGGDVLGLWTSGGTCATNTGLPSDEYLAWSGAKPSGGATLSPGGLPLTGFLVDLSASLVADDTQPVPVDHAFLCYSRFEQDGGAVFETDEVPSLLAAGYWYPVAAPGTAADGDNLGQYHLECNAGAGLKPTGKFVDDGGEVATSPQAAPYAIVG